MTKRVRVQLKQFRTHVNTVYRLLSTCVFIYLFICVPVSLLIRTHEIPIYYSLVSLGDRWLGAGIFCTAPGRSKSLTTAAVLFIGAAALCIWAFRQNDQSAESSAPKSADSGANVWLGIALAVVAIGLSVIMALSMDVENPTVADWQFSHRARIPLFLGASYLFDGRAALPRWRLPTLLRSRLGWLLFAALAIAAFFRFTNWMNCNGRLV